MKNFQLIKINASVSLEAILSIPDGSTSIIIFAHGSGSSVTSSRNQIVAQILNDNGFGTLLFDLLTKEEQESDIRTQRIIHEQPGTTLNKFNIELLTKDLMLFLNGFRIKMIKESKNRLFRCVHWSRHSSVCCRVSVMLRQ